MTYYIEGSTTYKRIYYKWDQPNATITGSLTNNDGVISGFSSSNYMQLPSYFTPGTKTWEIVFCVEDVGSSTTYLASFGWWGRDSIVTNVNLLPNRNTAGKFFAASGYGADSSGFLMDTVEGDMNATGKYYIKYEYTGTHYNLYLSSTSTFSNTPTDSVQATGIIDQAHNYNYIGIGTNSSGQVGSAPFSGKIYLKECYINIDGERWWNGYTLVGSTSSDYDYYVDVPKPKFSSHLDVKAFGPKNEEDLTSLEPWTQPTLSSDGTMGGSDYACSAGTTYGSGYEAWRAFDKSTSSFWNSNKTGSSTDYIIFYSPVLLMPSSISMRNRDGYVNAFRSGTVYGSTDGTNYISMGTFTNSNQNDGGTWTIEVTDPFLCKYIKVEGTGSGSGHTISIAEMTITAQQASPIPASRYKIARVAKLVPWTQPALTADGTVGGDSYACAASSGESGYPYPWRAFDSDPISTRWGPNGAPTSGNPCWIEFYSPMPLKVSKVVISFYSSGEVFTNGTLLGSTDRTTWTELGSYSNQSSTTLTFNVDVDNVFKYIRLTAKGTTGGWGKVCNFAITAEALNKGTYEGMKYKMVKIYS